MFTPTQQELEELGFEKSWYTDALLYLVEWTTVMIYIDWLFYISHVKLYPQSIEDIKNLIRLFTKQ